MRVLNYLELESHLRRSGIGTAARHQRRALADTDHVVVTSPWNGGGPARAMLGRLTGDPVFDCHGHDYDPDHHYDPDHDPDLDLDLDIDLVHCNLIGPGSVAVARHARRNGIPLVLHAHVTREDFAGSFRGSTAVGPALERYLRWFYSQADLVLCPSEYTRGVLKSYPVEAPIRSVTNGVDLEALSGHEALRATYRSRYGLADDALVVFAVGNVFERKGVSTFCRLARSLAARDDGRDYEFVWFGPYDTGPQASSTVRRWVRDPPANVTFTGWIDDVRGAYAAGDVSLLPSHVENQGIAVLEAMACGTPVVLRDLPVFREFFTDGEDCLTCRDPSEFRESIVRLAADPGLRDRLGENARTTAHRHGLDRVAAELQDAYAEAHRLVGE